MKKIIYTTAVISALTAALPLAVANVAAADVTVNATLANTEFNAAQDQDFTTTIFVPESSNIASFEAVINYDASAVSLKKAEARKDNNGTVEVNEKNGKIYLSYSAAENQTSQINVVDLTFHVNDDLAGGNYSFISLDTNETNNASSETESGDSTDYKLKSGFSDMTIYEYGDADLNGKIQSRDVTFLKQYVVKLRELSDLSRVYSNAYYDFEEDGSNTVLNIRTVISLNLLFLIFHQYFKQESFNKFHILFNTILVFKILHKYVIPNFNIFATITTWIAIW